MDTNTRLRDSADAHFTSTEALTALHIGPMQNPLQAVIMVPLFPQVADTLAFKVEGRNSSATVICEANIPHVHAAGLYKIPFFFTDEDLHDIVITLTYTDADTATVGDLGHVEVWLEPAGVGGN
jgi:hypothetical protein